MHRGLTEVLRMECPIAPGSTRVARKPEILATFFIEVTEGNRGYMQDCGTRQCALKLQADAASRGVQAFLFTKKPMWAQKAHAHYVVVVCDTEGNVHCTPL